MKHNPIKNKTRVTEEELQYFRERKTPAIQRRSDGAWFINKKLVAAYRHAKFMRMINTHSFIQPEPKP